MVELATVDITLKTTLEDVQETPPCMCCGFPTERAYIEHIMRGKDAVIRAAQVPGLACQRCGVSYFSNEGLLESARKAQEIFLAQGDTESVEIFRTVEERELQIIAQRELSRPRNIIRVE